MIPVLEIGGTHVSAALVDPSGWAVSGAARLALDGDASAETLIGLFADAAATVDAPADAVWGVAMPDPFDYVHGVGRFEGVGKFTSLHGVDVGAALRTRLGAPVAFVNDADAFALGEWASGAGAGATRFAGITLGTGVGSGWLVDGYVVDPGVPAGGRIHTMTVDGTPLEDVMSRRALRRAFASAGGDPALDVREICDAARAGDAVAWQVLVAAFTALGGVVARAIAGFGADVLVVGGSMTGSWDLLGPLFERALRDGGADVSTGGADVSAGGAGVSTVDALPPVRVSGDSDRAPLVGAALHASRLA